MLRHLPPRPLWTLPSAALGPVVIAILAGCSSDPGVLARVNDQVITVAQFGEAARANAMRYPGPPDSAKAGLLEDLVARELLVQGARREGLDKTPEFQVFARTVERQVLLDGLFQRLMSGPFPVSEAEVNELHERRAIATRARLIFTFDEAIARQARKDLARGEPFATVADRYNPTGMIPPGGDLGFLEPGSLLPPLDDLIRTGAPGQVLGPVAAGSEGWFLVHIEERRRQPQPPLAVARAELFEMLRQRKQRAALQRVMDHLRTEYQLVAERGAAQTMVSKLRQTPGDTPGLRTPPPPSPEERRLVLARYRGGTYTLGEAYDDLLSGERARPNLAMLPSVARWIESQTLERVALADAERRHLREEPAIARRIQEAVKSYLRDGYFQRRIGAPFDVGPEDLRAAYVQQQAMLARIMGARVVSVTMPDSASAAALAAQAQHVPTLREAAATVGVGLRVRDDLVVFPDTTGWAPFEGRLSMMSPGDIAGPFPVAAGWLIFQLREKQEGAPPFEGLSDAERRQLQGAAIALRRQMRLAALTDSLRKVFVPVVYRDRLERVAWPPAPAGLPGT